MLFFLILLDELIHCFYAVYTVPSIRGDKQRKLALAAICHVYNKTQNVH